MDFDPFFVFLCFKEILKVAYELEGSHVCDGESERGQKVFVLERIALTVLLLLLL